MKSTIVLNEKYYRFKRKARTFLLESIDLSFERCGGIS